MTTIYVVTIGSDEDYQIDGIYSTLELAKKYTKLQSWAGKDDGNYGEIEEWELDAPSGDVKALAVWIDKEGKTIQVYPTLVNLSKEKLLHYLFFDFDRGVKLSNVVITEDKQRAIKVTNELRTRLLACDQWYPPCFQCGGVGRKNNTLCSRCKGHGKEKRDASSR